MKLLLSDKRCNVNLKSNYYSYYNATLDTALNGERFDIVALLLKREM